MEVNRCLKDKAMDYIDHALGRPVDPLGETYRQHYVINDDSDLAAELRASSHWSEGMRTAGLAGTFCFFSVTNDGRKALKDHLNAIGDKHRKFVVHFAGVDIATVATSRSKARYRAYLDASECLDDLTFNDFCRRSRVRLAT